MVDDDVDRTSDVSIRPMDGEFILYRCLHGGPLKRETIGRLGSSDNRGWWEDMAADDRFSVNQQFLERVTRLYGSCAMLAWSADTVVGHVRFFPKALFETLEIPSLCMQQHPPHGVREEWSTVEFPSASAAKNSGLSINCMMTGSPSQQANPFQRRGVGSALITALVSWAREDGWAGIEAKAFSDLPGIYRITGQAGRGFWEKLGFTVMACGVNTDLEGEFLHLLETQALAAGLSKDDARLEFTMYRSLA